MIEPCKMQNQPLFLPRFPSKKPTVPHQPPKNSNYPITLPEILRS